MNRLHFVPGTEQIRRHAPGLVVPAAVNLGGRSSDSALFDHRVLVGLVPRDVVQERGGHELQVAATHPAVADALREAQPLVVSEFPCLDGRVPVLPFQRRLARNAETVGGHGGVGRAGPRHVRADNRLVHHRVLLAGVVQAARIPTLAIPQAQPEIGFVKGFVYEVGQAVAAFANLAVIVGQLAVA